MASTALQKFVSELMQLPIGTPVATPAGVPVYVQGRTFPTGTTMQELIGGAPASSVTVTSDGRAYVPEWHDGPVTGDPVYVERWDAEEGLTFHGWVDPTTRRLVQTG
jgi:hypothetical protein